jgi:hypothetical protein
MARPLGSKPGEGRPDLLVSKCLKNGNFGNLPVSIPGAGSTGLKANPFAVSEAKFVHECKPALPNGIGTIQPNTAQGELQTFVSASSGRDMIYEGGGPWNVNKSSSGPAAT